MGQLGWVKRLFDENVEHYTHPTLRFYLSVGKVVIRSFKKHVSSSLGRFHCGKYINGGGGYLCLQSSSLGRFHCGKYINGGGGYLYLQVWVDSIVVNILTGWGGGLYSK